MLENLGKKLDALWDVGAKTVKARIEKALEQTEMLPFLERKKKSEDLHIQYLTDILPHDIAVLVVFLHRNTFGLFMMPQDLLEKELALLSEVCSKQCGSVKIASVRRAAAQLLERADLALENGLYDTWRQAELERQAKPIIKHM